MKLVSVVIFVCFLSSAYAVSEQLDIEVRETTKDCRNKTIGNTIYSTFKINLLTRTKSLPSDGSFDKFAICILQKYNILKDDGTLNEDVDEYYLISDDPRKKEDAKICKEFALGNDIDGSSNEEKARKILDCFLPTEIRMVANLSPLNHPTFIRQHGIQGIYIPRG